MNYRIEGSVRRNKGNLIIFAILWLLIAIFVAVPISYSWHVASQEEAFDIGIFIETVMKNISSPQATFAKIIQEGAMTSFLKFLGGITLVFGVFFIAGMVRTAPKNEYSDIEHGSSDWSQHGEQYQILNKKKGIILAEDNYLPVDKRGNVNVLVVGRFRVW